MVFNFYIVTTVDESSVIVVAKNTLKLFFGFIRNNTVYTVYKAKWRIENTPPVFALMFTDVYPYGVIISWRERYVAIFFCWKITVFIINMYIIIVAIFTDNILGNR